MEGISRRDFIKTTSVSAAGASMLSLGQLSSAFGFKKKRASRVVIAKDEDCIGDQAKVQDMVDYSIMNLTGETDKGKAYEALFDSNLTTSSKILIKYNNSRTDKDNLVLKALVNGLTSMFNGTFPELPSSQLIGKATGDASNQTFETQNTTYAIRDIWVDCDYFINMPSAWAMNAPTYPGVTMSLKAMFPVVSGTLSRMHSNFTDETDPPLSVLCAQIRDLLGGKQVLVLLDGTTVSPTGDNNSTEEAYSVVASTDMVANNYHGIQILKEVGGFTSANETQALKVLELAAKDPYNLGTDNPGEMEVIRIGPPWNVEILSNGNISKEARTVRVKTRPAQTVFDFHRESGAHANLAIYDLQGRKVWSHRSTENRIVWNNEDIHGRKVSSGMYLFQLRLRDIIAQGKLAVK